MKTSVVVHTTYSYHVQYAYILLIAKLHLHTHTHTHTHAHTHSHTHTHTHTHSHTCTHTLPYIHRISQVLDIERGVYSYSRNSGRFFVVCTFCKVLFSTKMIYIEVIWTKKFIIHIFNTFFHVHICHFI